MKYDCWIPEYGQKRGDGRTVENDYPDMAAQDFVREHERRNVEYPVAAGKTDVEVMVCRFDEPAPTAKTYIVTGYAEPTYLARLKV